MGKVFVFTRPQVLNTIQKGFTFKNQEKTLGSVLPTCAGSANTYLHFISEEVFWCLEGEEEREG